jgi:hypothetical protein
MEIKNKLKEYALDPENAILNYDIGFLYYLEAHYAAAFNFFLRSAELSQISDKKNDLLSYQSLILCSNCIYRQGERPHAKLGFILHAMDLMPERPEAWFLYLRHFEEGSSWQECYTLSGLALREIKSTNSFAGSDYLGIWAIEFVRAKAAFRIGRGEESRKNLQLIVDRHYKHMDFNYQKWVHEEITRLGDGPGVNHIIRYSKEKMSRFKFPFVGLDSILGNYSQTYQDMFVLSVLKGKRKGTYLEIGSAHPHHNSNTALLEHFEWTGKSIEIKPELVQEFNTHRKNSAICANALDVDYEKLIKDNFEGTYIDYLQLDCEPPKTTFEILLSIPFSEYNFGVITYEHDHSMDMTRTYRDKSRRYLESLGYILLVNDISPNDWFTYEDWWVHPNFVESDIINKMKTKNLNQVNKVEYYFLNC